VVPAPGRYGEGGAATTERVKHDTGTPVIRHVLNVSPTTGAGVGV